MVVLKFDFFKQNKPNNKQQATPSKMNFQTQKNGKRVYNRTPRADVIDIFDNLVLTKIGKEVEELRTLEYWKSMYPKKKKIGGTGKVDEDLRILRMCLRSEINKEVPK